jgi:acetoin utilization protein AcuC
MTSFLQMPMLIHELAHTWCEGRWVALGGGGYDIWRVVPRAWSLLWLVMTEHPLIAELTKNTHLQLPGDWVSYWQSESPAPLPLSWLDPIDNWEVMPRREEISDKNRKTKELSLMYLR